LGAAGGRGTGAGGGSSWPLARGLGDAGLTSGPKAVREARGKAGWKRSPEGVSTSGEGGCGPQGWTGVSATGDVAKQQATSPIFLPPPGNRAGSARGSAGETPPSDSGPGGTPAAGTGVCVYVWWRGDCPFENRPGVRPSSHRHRPPST
jgi:hypothetical protein